MNASMWREIFIDEEKYVVSSVLVDETRKIMLTNLVELWTETLTKEQIIQKCQALNPLLSIEDIDIDGVISDLLNDIPQHTSQVSTNRISLQNEIEGGTFIFHIDLLKSGPEQFFEEVTRPLCLSISELSRKNQILIREVKRKDEEILEYKACGAELVRKHIETKKFTEDILKPKGAGIDMTSCIEVFQSLINENGISRFRRKAMKVESNKTVESSVSVVSEVQIKSERSEEKPSAPTIDCQVNRDCQKKTSRMDAAKTATEPEIEIHEVMRDNPPIAIHEKSSSTAVADRKTSKSKSDVSSLQSCYQKRPKRSLKDFIA